MVFIVRLRILFAVRGQNLGYAIRRELQLVVLVEIVNLIVCLGSWRELSYSCFWVLKILF